MYVHVPRKPFPQLKLRDRHFPLEAGDALDVVKVIDYVREHEEAQNAAVRVLPRLAEVHPSRVYFKYIFSSDNTEHQIPPRYWYYSTYLLAPESYIEVYVEPAPVIPIPPPLSPPPQVEEEHRQLTDVAPTPPPLSPQPQVEEEHHQPTDVAPTPPMLSPRPQVEEEHRQPTDVAPTPPPLSPQLQVEEEHRQLTDVAPTPPPLSPQPQVEEDYPQPVTALTPTPPPLQTEERHRHGTAIVELGPQGDSPAIYLIDFTVREGHSKPPN